MEKKQLDLNELADRQELKLTIASREDPAERDSRLRIEEARSLHERRKEISLYGATIGIVAATFGISAYIILASSYDGEIDKWATATLTSIVTGLVGYTFGKQSKNS